MINDPNIQGGNQIPRGAVYANGVRLMGVISFQVDNNSFFQADTFRVTVALSAQDSEHDFAWWSVQEKLEIELLAGFPNDTSHFAKSDLTSYLIGYADDIEFDPIADTMTLSGRDLTSLLIDYKRAIAFVGEMTASGVVTQIANERGLIPVVTATQKPAGTYYQIFHKLIASEITYWDLVTRLAQIEQFQVYVKGHELHFEPRTAPDADPYVIRWQNPSNTSGSPSVNVTRMRFSRNLSIAKDIKVRVLSFNPKTKKAVDVTAERKRAYNKTTAKATKYTGAPQEYVYKVANMTDDQAQRRAESMLDELSRHEVNLSADMPGDSILTVRNIIKVEGTDTAFDQTYYPSTITRTYGKDEGFTMAVQAKNQTPNNPT